MVLLWSGPKTGGGLPFESRILCVQVETGSYQDFFFLGQKLLGSY